jgi:transposase
LTAVWVPDAANEALRDLVRARLAAKRDQLRARNRRSKFLLRHGRRTPEGTVAWTLKYLAWVKQQSFEQAAQQATLIDYLHEVEHEAERIVRLERSIDAAIETLPEKMRAVIEALQSLRGIAKISAVSIMAEVGEMSRFEHARQLMGYSGAVSWEDSSGPRVHRGGISKAGNAHLRRTVVEAAWAYRHRPGVGNTLRARQRARSPGMHNTACTPATRSCSQKASPSKRSSPRWAGSCSASSGPSASRPSARKPPRPGARSSGAPEVNGEYP